ncbi:hypothetical protein TBLA_0A05430 [Henningerozyma blattae CBS 6284]|uniref:GDP/GTP exchange factor Sec2 N-terminal domain-containing protein n=1 Tax=Henningerozyma blattae (strain ATCC 34711 / CBS 6284 / DSM 70876 / NBRC 10599 / NRRL Y-10934 / UCD 77-7) TaxID=1071380 RepID=I2GW34_HENB6|nr:hypothetical protein TBLA_0A05430 [Tetrapisispora blattae CBS 6284]CCH58336.1 hypothetical protein TBLA_0A05430 [Tetrapisispora blattae CBS 6284]
MSEQEIADESQRVTDQVTLLSTQLMESISKQSQLEDKLNQANKKLAAQKLTIEKNSQIKATGSALQKNANDLESQLKIANAELVKERQLREKAEGECTALNKEVEDLTASLFDEANHMVADARKEKAAVELRNTKLMEQLKEKDTVLETLELQLKNLKKVLQEFQDEDSNNKRNSMLSEVTIHSGSSQRAGSPTIISTTNSESFANIIYSPNISDIRYDLPLYGEFLKFVAVLPFVKNIKQTTNDSKLLRRLVNDEIQPVLRLDNADGLGWVVKRTLLTQMMEGLVMVEPLSGVNELYTHSRNRRSATSNNTTGSTRDISGKDTNGSSNQKNSHLFNFPTNSPPVAVHEPCAFCNEKRDDSVQHARIHLLKTQSRSETGKITVTNQFPLCQSCVLKVRQTGEIFAFLRSLALGTWKLEKIAIANLSKSDPTKIKGSPASPTKDKEKEKKKAKRKSFIKGLNMAQTASVLNPATSNPFFQQTQTNPVGDTSLTDVDTFGQPTTNIQRAWLQLCKLRCMLHWSHMGIWSLDDSIEAKFAPLSISESNIKDLDQNTDNFTSSQLPSTSPSNNNINSTNTLMHRDTQILKNHIDTTDQESFSLKQETDDAFDFENNSIDTKLEKLNSTSNNSFKSPLEKELKNLQEDLRPSDKHINSNGIPATNTQHVSSNVQNRNSTASAENPTMLEDEQESESSIAANDDTLTKSITPVDDQNIEHESTISSDREDTSATNSTGIINSVNGETNEPSTQLTSDNDNQNDDILDSYIDDMNDDEEVIPTSERIENKPIDEESSRSTVT